MTQLIQSVKYQDNSAIGRGGLNWSANDYARLNSIFMNVHLIRNVFDMKDSKLPLPAAYENVQIRD